MNELKQLRELVVTIEGLLAVLSVRPTDDMAQNALNKAYVQFKECYENIFNTPSQPQEDKDEPVASDAPAPSEEPQDIHESRDYQDTNDYQDTYEPDQSSETAEFHEPNESSESYDSNSSYEAYEPQEPSTGEKIRLDEMLSRRGASDLRNAFTLNDKFRFRRCMFNNSDAQFTDAIDLLNAMDTYAEATDYLFGDLHLNEDDPDVQDFMSIIRNHFCV